MLSHATCFNMVLSVYLFFLRQFLSVSIGFYLFSFVFCLLFYPFLSVLSPLFSFLSVSIYLICFSSVFICFKIWDFLKNIYQNICSKANIWKKKKNPLYVDFWRKKSNFLKSMTNLGHYCTGHLEEKSYISFFCWKNPKSMIFCSRVPEQLS